MNNSPDVIHLFVCQFWRILKMNYPSAAIADFSPRAFPEGRDIPLYKPFRYVPPQRVGFWGLCGLKIARTQTLFYFSCRSFQKIGECWWSINIPWFLFWRENRGSVNRLVWKQVYALPILAWNWVWFSRGLRERMNVCYCFNSQWIRTK